MRSKIAYSLLDELANARARRFRVGCHFAVIDVRFVIEARIINLSAAVRIKTRAARIGFARDSAQAATDLVPHLFAEGLPARRSLALGDIVPVENIEVVEDRMTIAGHRQDAEL